ncbi:TonB-dependent receptor [Mesorhizobium soli]|uniref:TonB-dependent receptor n=1 Tax=Pseudaminobacter soli (ex Li et al. 2025) TaxID=1295366 RepID=A0A2P7SNV3_9HYPH|nr:TonB-dependent receptor [Mesorhizobium soli]
MRYILLNISIALLGSTFLVQQASAQAAQAAPQSQTDNENKAENEKKPRLKPANSDVFELGRIVVHGGDGAEGGISGQAISQSIVTADDVRKTNRDTLDDALSIVPGVSTANAGGSRNERLIYVRGYDRFQVPLYIDGIRVYLPADNRLDYGRFLTPDLSEIQVQKGYASVLNGPGGMGGAINLVTRKPTKEFEGEIQNGIDIGNTGGLAAYTGVGSVGTRQENFYLQAAGAYRKSDGWFLSRNFEPTAVEDGGRRDFSDFQDWRINLKAGYTPNATDEYVISYTRQAGEKNAPYSVNEPIRISPTPPKLPNGLAYQRDWRWPAWNLSSLAFYSHTQIGDDSYVKTKAYYNTFYNLLSAYDDSHFNSQTQSRAFNSYYDDNAYGFSVEGGTDLIPMNSLKTAVHYRRDNHTNWDHNQPDVSSFVDPKQTKLEDTWSLALEDTFHATDTIDFVGGVSYDKNKLLRAEKYDSGTKKIFEHPLGGSDAVNWQAAAIYRPTDTAEFHASVSSRTRFPTLFERYSTRFGDALPNPDLKPERATNFELGWSDTVFDNAHLGAAVFYSNVQNVIQSIGVGNNKVQNQNVGDGRYYGFEIVGEWDVLPELTLGANYTYLKRQLVDPVRDNLEPVGTPLHNAYIYANWQPYENFTVSPGLQLSSSRWSTDRLENNFFETSGFALANLDFQYDFSDQVSANFGVRNLFDANYELADGFPEPGRTFFLTTRVVF